MTFKFFEKIEIFVEIKGQSLALFILKFLIKGETFT